MKETDYNVVCTQVDDMLNEDDDSILRYLPREVAVLAIANIYFTNDLCTGFGQDFQGTLSVISSMQRISVIHDSHHSFYKSESALCQYVDLEDDIRQILIVLETAIVRMEAQM